MEESHQRSIIDHLELGPGGHHLQEDLSKGVLRTIHNVENGTLHFITIPPAANSREQEYIESSLDLLSSHLPNGLLVDYIGAPGSSTPNNQFHQPATNLLDHHGGGGAGGIQTYTAEDLQTLVDASSLQTSESERKLFLQFVNKPPSQMSHEAPVIVTNPKDISSINSLGDHDKLSESQLTGVNHMPVVTSGNSFLHYHHQDQLLSSTHSGVNSMTGTGNILATSHHHNAHHLHQHQHQQQQHQQQQNQSHLSSIHSMLQGECSPSKLFHVTSSAAATSTNIAINTVTSQNCIQMPPLTPIKRIESPKRYLSYQMVQTPQQQQPQQVADDNFLSRDDLMECEVRSDDDEDMANSHFTNTYLPHKKRLSKKLGDPPKGVTQAEQFHRDSVISNDHQQLDQAKSSTVDHSSSNETPKKKAFACQLCSDSFEDQLNFFTHLKGHYEPVGSSGSPIDDGKVSDPKKKPKLPRVKHTKKLKNDKSSRTTPEEPCPQIATIQQPQPTGSGRMDVIVSSGQQPDPDNPGEFSETEDMLEGIRTAVQKVQEAVDTDTNDGLGVARTALGVEKAWYQQQQQQHQPQQPAMQQDLPSSQQTDMVKPIDFNSDLDTQEIHINAGNDNFVLFLNKSDFNEQDMLDHQNHPGHHHQPQQHQHQHSMLADQLQSTHHPNPPHPASSSSYILDTDQQLQQPIGDCDMNIQILGFSSSEIDFNLASAPHQLSELSGAKLLKDEQRSIAGSDSQLGDTADAEFYMSEEDEEAVDEHCGNEEQQFVEERVEMIAESMVPEKRKGRKKLVGEVPPETEEQQAAGSKKPAKKFPCAEPDCDKIFNSKTAVRYHELQHKNERPFNCPLCPKNFFTSSALKVHERLHSGEKPYKCEECGRAFRQWGDMKYHQSSIHSNEKSHQCEFCGKKFARRYSLVLHRKIHLNEKNYVCDICNKAFRASSYLQSHRMIHTGEKPFSCTICSKKFRCGGDMKRHLKTHDRTKSTGGKFPDDDAVVQKATLPRAAINGPPKKAPSDVIDLTKIKSEGNQAKIIQAPPVVTVLAKDVSHVATGSRVDPSGTGQLVYLTAQQNAADQFRKPDETVLMDMGRW